MKKILFISATVLSLATGLLLLFYPTISNFVAERNQSTAIQEYNSALAQITAEKRQEEKEKAIAYNSALTGTGIQDPFIPGSGVVLPENYTAIFSLFEGIIGQIEIPAINVSLLIYHGTSEAVLQKGIGHMERTAFPIGGVGNHSVLTGHTGLPRAKLFSDLVKLKNGDVFYIHILEEKLTYEVDQILVLEPEDTEQLRPVQGKDYVTLVTCTPYGVNSHRLFVRGTRITNLATETGLEAKEKENNLTWIIWVLVVFIILAAGWLGRKLHGHRRKGKSKR